MKTIKATKIGYNKLQNAIVDSSHTNFFDIIDSIKGDLPYHDIFKSYDHDYLYKLREHIIVMDLLRSCPY